MKKAIKEVYRVLKRKGTLIISDVYPQVTERGYIMILGTDKKIRAYHRKISEYFNILKKYFSIERFEEYYLNGLKELQNYIRGNIGFFIIFKTKSQVLSFFLKYSPKIFA